MVNPNLTSEADRPGNTPRVPDGSRVYAIGDIHGRIDLLRSLHRLILDDASEAAAERLVVVYLGDYVDRGPRSFEVIDALINDPLAGFEAVYLKGNHEDFLLRFVGGEAIGEAWLMNGAVQTLDSYAIDVFGLPGAFLDMASLRRDFEAALPPDHLKFLNGLALSHVEGDYLFVHAGIRPEVPIEAQDEYDLLWIRDAFLGSETAFEKLVVHGHSIDFEPQHLANRIGIDTGAYFTGRLTCLVLEGAERRFLHT